MATYIRLHIIFIDTEFIIFFKIKNIDLTTLNISCKNLEKKINKNSD